SIVTAMLGVRCEVLELLAVVSAIFVVAAAGGCGNQARPPDAPSTPTSRIISDDRPGQRNTEPHLAVSPDGRVVAAAWISTSAPGGSMGSNGWLTPKPLAYAFSGDGGDSWGAVQTLAPLDTAESAVDPWLQADASGNVHMAWYGWDSSIYYSRASAGTASFA